MSINQAINIIAIISGALVIVVSFFELMVPRREE